MVRKASSVRALDSLIAKPIYGYESVDAYYADCHCCELPAACASCSVGGMSDGEGEEYYDAYFDVEVHELMINDEPRLEAYRAAVEAAADHIRGKVVVDVGCGTGILSLLCARAGAKKVWDQLGGSWRPA